MKTRDMAATDASAVATIIREMGYTTTADDVRRRFENLTSLPNNALLVATRGETLIGWVHVQLLHRLQTEGDAVVVALFVKSSARKAGVGRALLDACRDWAKPHGFADIRLL